MCTKYTTTVRNNVCCKFILEYNQYEIYKTYEQRVVGPFVGNTLSIYKDTVLTLSLNELLTSNQRPNLLRW